MDNATPTHRDEANWAASVDRLSVPDVPAGARSATVEGRRLTGPLQGFGQMWQKTYRVAIDGVTPEEVIDVWKREYGDFWPETNRFYAPLAGIQPGEVGLISGRSGPTRLSTGVMVLYADDRSFAYMTPEGHPFAGWITFDAEDDDGTTVAQVQALIRANDALYEVGFALFGNRAEDRMWAHTLRSLARRFGVDGEPTIDRVKVDRKRCWRNFGNVRHNAMLTGMFRRGGAGTTAAVRQPAECSDVAGEARP